METFMCVYIDEMMKMMMSVLHLDSAVWTGEER